MPKRKVKVNKNLMPFLLLLVGTNLSKILNKMEAK